MLASVKNRFLQMYMRKKEYKKQDKDEIPLLIRQRHQQSRQLLLLDVSDWDISQEQWIALTNYVGEKNGFQNFLRENDRRLALGSRLIQRSLIEMVFGEDTVIDIGRTARNKPYFAGLKALLHEHPDFNHLKNWNFSVSHHGKYVLALSEPISLCGIDIVEDALPHISKDEGIDEYLKSFKRCFTNEEWSIISNESLSDGCKNREFLRHWAMKESFVKAIGSGLSYNLQQLCFKYIDGSEKCRANVYVNSILKADWNIDIIDYGHYIISIARGPPQDCCPEDLGIVQLNTSLENGMKDDMYRFSPADIKHVELHDLLPLHIREALTL